jgi:hypothetical protein
VPFTLPFIFAQRVSVWRPPSAATLLGVTATLFVFMVAFHDMSLTTSGGGLITKVGLLLGWIGVPFVILAAVLGWWAIAAAVTSGWNNAILFGFAIFPLLLAGYFFQRYLDPLGFTIVLLLSSRPLSRQLLTERSIVAGYLLFLGLEAAGLTWFVFLGHSNPNA